MVQSRATSALWTIDEFLEAEMQAPEGERWELINGVLWRSMTGGTQAHNFIVCNIREAIRAGLRQSGKRCSVYSENLKLKIDDAGGLFYPDIAVVCASPQLDAVTIANPVLIAEVLSKSTAAKDRLEKWPAYSSLESLQQIVYVRQDTPIVELWNRDAKGWAGRELVGLDETLDLHSVGVTVPLSVVYEDVFGAP